jgi:hypothetical protein
LESPFPLPCAARPACPRARTQNWHQPRGADFFWAKKNPAEAGFSRL